MKLLLYASLLMLFSVSHIVAVVIDNQTDQAVTAHISFAHGTSDAIIQSKSSKTINVGGTFSIIFHYQPAIKVQPKTIFDVTDREHVTIKGDGKTTLNITR